MKKRFTERRQLLKAGVAGFAAALPGWGCAIRATESDKLLGFGALPVSTADRIVVPPGYRAQVLYRWGDPVGIAGGQPEFQFDGSNSAAEQELQAGMHHDAVELFPLSSGGALLAINHEYTDDGLLHSDGMKTWSAEKVRKAQAAMGVSIIEVALAGNEWRVVRPSKYARRITAYTRMRISGPAAGHPALGVEAFGTINNCAGGRTPWGTYLACEENFNGYFVNAGTIPPEQRRYGISARGAGYRWHEFDARFDAAANPTEPNRFGWVRTPSRRSAPRSAASSMKRRWSLRPTTTASWFTWETTSASSMSTNSSRAAASTRRTGSPTAACSMRGRSTSRVSMQAATASGYRCRIRPKRSS